jgi:hypothetical protein
MSRAFVFLVALGCSAITLAQPPPRDTSAKVTGTASIRGRVTDASGRPLARVDIRAGSSDGQQANGLTDAEGRFDLNGLLAGTYTVTAAKPNYVRSAWGEQRPEGPGQRITLADGETLGNINFRLARAGVIAGTLVDESGDPVTDARVVAMRYQYVQGTRRLIDDRYRVRLLPGDYYAVAMSDVEPGAWTDRDFLSRARERATRFSIVNGETKTIDLPLSPAPVF